MDQFGVLVESIGFKSQSKSTPLADLKGQTNSNNGFPPNLGRKPSSNSGDGSGHGGVFGSNNVLKTQNSNGFDDAFGGLHVYDLDSVFKGSNNSGAKSSGFGDDSDDIFGGFTEAKSSSSVNYDNVFGKINAPPKWNDSNDDLLGGFSNVGSKPNGATVHKSKNSPSFDDLIPGFGGSSESRNGSKSVRSSSQQSSDQSDKSNKVLVEDPFNIFESSSPLRNNTSTLITDPLDQGASKSSVWSSIDDLEDFATGRMGGNVKQQSNTYFGDGLGKLKLPKQGNVQCEQKRTGTRTTEKRVEDKSRASDNVDDMESFFGMGTRPTNIPSSSSVTEDSIYDTLFQKSKPPPNQRSGSSSTTKKVPPVKNVDNDFSFLFGVEVTPSSGVFQEVEGESEERRRARLNHYKNTQERMIKALNEKNQRDLQVQLEQEEKHRLADSLDNDIKRWASGKEGNLRALLSSLQYVLWPECGWQPVSLTDMITSISVKKVYQKATLCVHPDKVQQKGANIQQKYIAEKVFDLLKEAYTKFSSEEL